MPCPSRRRGASSTPLAAASDLAAGRVRFVGKAEQRIIEDYLRLLRFFRFNAYYGRGALDAEARAAAEGAWRRSLQTLSVERVREELLRILAAPDPLLGPRRDEILERSVPRPCRRRGGLACLTVFPVSGASLRTGAGSAVTPGLPHHLVSRRCDRLGAALEALQCAASKRLERTTACGPQPPTRRRFRYPGRPPKAAAPRGPRDLGGRALQLHWAALDADGRRDARTRAVRTPGQPSEDGRLKTSP